MNLHRLDAGSSIRGDFMSIQLGVSKNRGTPKWMVYSGRPFGNIQLRTNLSYSSWANQRVEDVNCVVHSSGIIMPTPSNLYITTVPDMLHNCHQPKIVGVAIGMLSPTSLVLSAMSLCT